MRGSDSFDEALGWALQWEGSALIDWEASAARSGNGWGRVAPRLGHLLVDAEGPLTNGMDASFREPRGWALGWDAEALSAAGGGVA